MKRTRPGPGQESVWDYPRPPRVEATLRHVVVMLGGRAIAETRRALRVLETSHPPTYYIHLEDIHAGALTSTSARTICEYKGVAHYFDVSQGDRREEVAAWHYPEPRAGYEDLAGHVAFYPGRMDACYIDGELVSAQSGGFYAGWITADIVGPFKGDPGTSGW